MRVLITAGPTREPIDPVRYIGNRSSGRMGAAIATAAIKAGHQVTLVLGPVTAAMPKEARRLDVETARQMLEAVTAEFPGHDLLIMAAAVADYRPIKVASEKLGRSSGLVIQCEPTEDIVAAVARSKRPDQRIIGFSLESEGNIARAREKLIRKRLDMIVYNPIETMNSATVRPMLLWAEGRTEELPASSKERFGELLVERATALLTAG
jgi:phosphopantothenoylcysteine decarboxylase/phosphopantothenate--cysteine ligase